jgi:hypothetical protein
MFALACVLVLSYLLFLLFRGTMNRIQYIERLGLYWITKDNGVKGTPWMQTDAFMRQTDPPYWRGHGVQFRFGQLTFQVGLLTMRVDSLASQLSASEYFDQITAKQIRKWVNDEEAQEEAV